MRMGFAHIPLLLGVSSTLTGTARGPFGSGYHR
jgi:hypothetical protein